LRARWPRVRVLFMSGYDRDYFVGGHALDASAIVLRKPFSAEELTLRLDELLTLQRTDPPEGTAQGDIAP
jgi:DNA-binding response OmpR family regulator